MHNYTFMEWVKDVLNSNFSILVLDSRQYNAQIPVLLKYLPKNKKICYLCLSRPLSDVKEYFNKNEIDYSGFCFIDVLSSHYKFPELQNNCIFVDSPTELRKIVDAILDSINLKNSEIILFDTISSLLHYSEPFEVIKLTHNVKSESLPENIMKIFIINKDEILPDLDHGVIKDLSMFADNIINLGD